MNHEEVIRRFATRKINSRTKTVQWSSNNVYCCEDLMFSYGSHFILAKYLGRNLFIRNSDKYSSSTSHHQSMTAQHCPGPEVSCGLISKEKLSLVDFSFTDILFFLRGSYKWCVKDIETNIFYDEIEWTEEHGTTLTDEFVPPAHGLFKANRKPLNHLPRFQEGSWITSGITVFKKKRKVYLYSSDKKEDFLVQLKGIPDSIEQAVALSPRKPFYW